ncbi:hypothetical protein ACQ4M4_20575 [Leptolyngbya sp. AN02str]|uniref:hypothetical protein n=1 Tax=Leptolyngbya sp. AN02str TaxID=3423363 RepID=UPI003D31EC3C
MTPRFERPIDVHLLVQPEHPELLTGLDVWMELGLLTDEQVRSLCLQYLVCPVKQPRSQSLASSVRPSAQVTSTRQLTAAGAGASDFAPIATNQASAQSAAQASAQSTEPQPKSAVQRTIEAFVAEASVIWLLLLGVFLVVVSSTVLAASQWQNVSPLGQYLVLLGSTLAIWGAGLWLGRNPKLKLTSRMLRLATLLLVPINFWLMDALPIGQSGSGLGVGAIATVGLSGILLREVERDRSNTSSQLRGFRWANGLNAIALSWLHWGWAWSGIPLLATYLGTIGTAANLAVQSKSAPEAHLAEERSDTAAAGLTSMAQAAIALSALLLLGRAALIASVPVAQLGLALGICGWLLCWVFRFQASRGGWSVAGAGLLVLGWVVSVGEAPPWQAIAISGLALGLVVERIDRLRRPLELSLAMLIGLQAYGLLWWLIPQEPRQQFVARLVQWFGVYGIPSATWGVAIFPYLVGMMVWLVRLRRTQQMPVTQQGDRLLFIIGVCSTLLSLSNPWMRALNLTFSAITLSWLLRQRVVRSIKLLVYTTHLAVLGAALSWVAVGFSQITPTLWAAILLGGVAVEWLLVMDQRYPLWAKTAWHFGLSLAGLSYLLLATADSGTDTVMWLVVPGLLTLLSYRAQFRSSGLAATLSILALLLSVWLVVTFPTPRLITWLVAAVLVGFNTERIAQGWEVRRTVPLTLLSVGFGIAAYADGVNRWVTPLSVDQIWLAVAIAVGLLWLGREVLYRRQTVLLQAYAHATNAWAVFLTGLGLSAITLACFFALLLNADLEPTLPIAGLIFAGAIAFRLVQQPTNLAFAGLGWAVELLVTMAIWTAHEQTLPRLTTLAIATLGLGLASQLAGDGWVRWRRGTYWPSWHGVPLLYAVLGLFVAHHEFTATTGLYTLAAGVITVFVGRRDRSLKPILVVGLAELSVAAYELVVYQLLQAPEGDAGDGVTLLAGVAIVVAIAYMAKSPLLTRFLPLAPLEVRAIAHFHWLLGFIGLVMAWFMPRSSSGINLWVGLCAALAAYALALANRYMRWGLPQTPANLPEERTEESRRLSVSATSAPHLWTFAGIGIAFVAIAEGLSNGFPNPLWLSQWGGAIAAVVALGLYGLPWQRWGWHAPAWQHAMTAIPMLTVLLTASEIRIPALLLIAAFYMWIARLRDQLAFSYLGLALFDWAVLKFLSWQGWLEPLWLSVVIGGSLLYIAQVEPTIASATARSQRHLLRCLATGLICLTAIYQSEFDAQGSTLVLFNIVAIALSLAFILVGLWLKVRAFLFIGTIAFAFKVLRQLWLFIDQYPIMLWAVLGLLGLLLVWVAATFETRRSQMNAVLGTWLDELNLWA